MKKISTCFKQTIFLVSLILTPWLVSGQTTIINPATDGSFDLPGGFIGNGWTVVNGTAVNTWQTSSVPSMFTSNSAFISNDNGISHSFTNTSSSVVHFYKDITFPAGETKVTLIFDWVALGETGFYDAIIVSLAPITYTPTASTTSLGLNNLGAPTIEVARLWNSSTVQTANISIPASATGNCITASTMRLIFTWKNDGTGGTPPSAAIDNISLVSNTLSPSPGIGNYTIDNTLATSGNNFNSFTDAVNWLNAAYACGLSNPITFNVTAGQTFTETSKIITASGSILNPITFQKSGIGSNPILKGINGIGSTDACISIIGGDFFIFDGIDVEDDLTNLTSTTQMEYGYAIKNASATDGASNNIIRNSRIKLNNLNTSSIGIIHTSSTTGGGFTPTNATGQNDNNKYLNINVESSGLGGIFLTSGSSTYPGTNNEVGATTGNKTYIGSSYSGTQNGSIGGGSSVSSYGVQANNQSSVKIHHCVVRDIMSVGTNRGIYVTGGQGNVEVYNNIVTGVRNSSTTSTSSQRGMDLALSTTGTHTLTAYNNFISDVTSAHSSTITSTRVLNGIVLGSGSATSTYNIDFNSISIDGSSSLTVTSVCLALGSSTPTNNIRNNILANYTGAQTGTAKHYCIYSTTATAMGSATSVSDYNDFYIANTTNGFTALTSTTDRASINDWDVAIITPAAPIDNNSIALDPQFTSNVNDLHTYSVNVNGKANMTGITWANNDIDDQVRNSPHDIGADDFTPITLDLGASTLVAPVSNNCYSSTENVTVQITNYGANAIDFTTDNTTVTCNITGAITQTLTTTLNNNSLNSGSPLAVGATLNVPMGTINMSSLGTYTFNAYTTSSGDGLPTNDTMPTKNILISAGNATVVTDTICNGESASLTLSGYTGTLQWQMSTNGGSTWSNITSATNPTLVDAPTVNTQYRAEVCNNFNSNVISVTVINSVAPTVTHDTLCAPGTVNLAASGNGTLKWYNSLSSTTAINTGTTYSPSVLSTDTFYVENIEGNTTYIGGRLAPAATTSTTASTYGLVFDANKSFTLNSVNVYPAGTAGNLIVQLQNNTGGIIFSDTVPIPAGSATTPYTVNLNYPITPGIGYRLIARSSPSMVRESSLGGFPYALGGGLGNITSGYISGVSQTYYYFYSWNVSAGCESGRTPVYAVVNTPDPILLSTNKSAICLGDTSTILVTSSNSLYNYNWSPTASLNTSTGSSVKAFPTNTTKYYVNANDINGCIANDSITITVNSLPSIFLGNDTTLCSGQTFMLDATNAFSSYLWSTNDTTQTIGTTISGNYSVTVTDANGCKNSDTISLTFTICVDIAELSKQIKINVYPNPSNGVYTVDSPELNNVTIIVTDIQGKTITKDILNKKAVIDISEQPKGIYLIHFVNDEISQTIKVLKQ